MATDPPRRGRILIGVDPAQGDVGHPVVVVQDEDGAISYADAPSPTASIQFTLDDMAARADAYALHAQRVWMQQMGRQ